MPLSTPKNRILYIFFGFFVANAVVAELISVKLFDFGGAIGLPENTYIMAMGLLPWPIVFLATDAINEFYGSKVVRQLSLVTSALLIYVFLVLLMADSLPAFDDSATAGNMFNDLILNKRFDKPGVNDQEFSTAFSQSKFLIIGSVSAFLVGQLIDITLFRLFKKWSRGKYIWLRATGSTVISQFIDTILVIGIAFYLPGDGETEKPLMAIVVVERVPPAVLIALVDRQEFLVVHRHQGEAHAVEIAHGAFENGAEESDRSRPQAYCLIKSHHVVVFPSSSVRTVASCKNTAGPTISAANPFSPGGLRRGRRMQLDGYAGARESRFPCRLGSDEVW